VSSIRRLDRKARTALALAVALILAAPILAVRNCVMSAQEGGHLVASANGAHHGLIELHNGDTHYVHSRVLARKLSEWLKLGANARAAIAIDGSNFASGSAEPTADGRLHITQVAQILNSDRRLHAKILVTDSQGGTSQKLETGRASRLQSELLAQRVDPGLTSDVEPPAALAGYHVIRGDDPDSHLFILIWRQA
jgi:hypothetical protein